MPKASATTLAILTGVAALAIPILVSLKLAQRQSLQSEMDRALRYATEVIGRSERTDDQIYGGIDKLVRTRGDSGDAPCSDMQLALMREIDLNSSYLQAIGYVSGERLLCSSMGLHPKGLALGPVEQVTKYGTTIRNNVSLTTVAPKTTFIVIQKGSYAAIIHKSLPIDVSTKEKDISLATFTPGYHEFGTARGLVKPEWIDRLEGRNEVTFFDGEYVVAVAQSTTYSAGAVAAVPVAYLNKRVREFAFILLPIGLLAGIVLAYVARYLAKLQQSLPALMRTALRKKEFFLLYQPLVDLQTREWVGAEALIRWRQADGTLVRPDQFIPAAEESGMIQRITQHVLQLVAKDSPEIFRRYPDFHIGVNLSSDDLHTRDTISLLQELLRNSHAGAHNILIEATERGFMNADVAREIVKDIRALGIDVAIDDFGTGYSSLSYLESFELDYLKIDKSFIDTIGTDAATSRVVLHIIQMAKSLDLKMIAEGVETEAQEQFLREHGVQYAQGWLFGKPMPVADLLRELARAKSARAA
ncbi:EAL domain-containing protein [Undibacterium sp.]|jgi:sensor c-di-GMP phosphodiesterase-like protein|uniref:EAL domain-containing protein n=1 Tax=Undibacterium sp. TaxID=1914977 RepID=UPI002B7BF265|nr:EAL domain-containing protein [Undibacterium sp.]HTD02610.1 EAL domain-containing protein [Undibacterium sp.]